MLKKITFDDFVRLGRGFDLPDDKIVTGEYPVVTSTNIKAYHNEYKIDPPVVVTGRSGSLGKVQYVTEKCWPLNTALYSKDFRNNVPKYVYYFLQTMHLEQYNAGAGVPTLNQNHLQRLKISVHEREEQERVAAILSAYDDLIESNNRRIALLEKAAQELYKEWFVRFRFPGYENTKFEGDIPKGWETRRLGDVLDIKRGGSPRPIQDFLTNDGLKWLKISDATKSSNPFVFNIEESIKEEGLRKTVYLKAGSLVLSNSATPGLPRILAIDTCIHDGWLYFTNQNLSNEFLFLFFNHIRPNLVNKGNGAVFTNLKTDILKKYLFARPEDRVLQQFDNAIKPIFNQIYTITKQNVNLTMQRDLLLPRLMSGKMEV